MLRRILLAAVVAAAVGFATFWWLTTPAAVPSNLLPAYAPNLANGLTTFNAGGCSSCHAVPGQPDRLRVGGGLAIPSPFGTFYAPNISPDPADGIGRWTEAEFVGAVTKGVAPAGFHYFPAFPYTSYAHARVEDVRDLFAYLKTLPAVSGKVRDHDVPFPFNVRSNVGIWKLLFMEGKPFAPDAARSAQWNRGAYLVNSLGHCAECHSPRSEYDIGYFLETGEMPDGDKAGGSMRRVIRNTSQLSPEDRAAMAEYLKSLPPVQGPTPPANAPKHEHN
jgi:mono/diheme cytochrome c family protein